MALLIRRWVATDPRNVPQRWRIMVPPGGAGTMRSIATLLLTLLAIDATATAATIDIRKPDTLAPVIAGLRSGDEDETDAAILALGEACEALSVELRRSEFWERQGQPARSMAHRSAVERFVEAALPDLVELRRASDASVRRAVLAALGALETKRAEVVGLLMEGLDDPVRSVADEAAWALVELSPDPSDLAVLLASENPTLRDAVAQRLESSEGRQLAGRLVPEILDAVTREPDPRTQTELLRALSKVGSLPSNAVPILIDLLHSRDWSVRREAVRALGDMGPAAREARDDLEALLGDESSTLFLEVAEAIDSITDSSGSLLQRMIEVARDIDSPHRQQALEAIGMMYAAAAAAVPCLIEALDDRDPRIRSTAALALARVGPAAAVLPQLIDRLDDPDSGVRIYAMMAIRKHGPAASGAVPALLSLARDEHRSVRAGVAETLGMIGWGSEAVIKTLLGLMSDPDSFVGHDAAMALGRVGRQWDGTVPALIGLLGADRFEVQRAALDAMRVLGPDISAGVLPSVLAAFDGAGPKLRIGLADALEVVGAGSMPALEALVRELGNGEAAVRTNAALALGRLGLESGLTDEQLETLMEPVPERLERLIRWNLSPFDTVAGLESGFLEDELRTGSQEARILAALGLAKLGFRARDALPSLRRAEKGEYEEPRPPRGGLASCADRAPRLAASVARRIIEGTLPPAPEAGP